MAGGYTYDEGATVITEPSLDTQPMETSPLSPCGKALKTKLTPPIETPTNEEAI